MKPRAAMTLTGVFGLAMMAGVVQGGPIEDARQLAASGRHGEVDAALKPLLEKTPASPEALRISFESAVADGRLYTAERRALSLLDDSGKPAPDTRCTSMAAPITAPVKLFSTLCVLCVSSVTSAF